MTNTSKKDKILVSILCIYYLICFQERNNNIDTLINFDNESNTITLAYIFKLSL